MKTPSFLIVPSLSRQIDRFSQRNSEIKLSGQGSERARPVGRELTRRYLNGRVRVREGRARERRETEAVLKSKEGRNADGCGGNRLDCKPRECHSNVIRANAVSN